MTLDKAIEILKEQYNEAMTLDHVQKPVAYALYQAWKRVDKAERKKKK